MPGKLRLIIEFFKELRITQLTILKRIEWSRTPGEDRNVDIWLLAASLSAGWNANPTIKELRLY